MPQLAPWCMKQSIVKVTVLSKYGPKGASSRIRYRQYEKFFNERGVIIDFKPLLSDQYLEKIYNGKNGFLHLCVCYLKRLMLLLKSSSSNIFIIEKELFPFTPFFIECILLPKKTPFLVDYDDAIFATYENHKRRLIRNLLKNKIPSIIRKATGVIAGNAYLGSYAKKSGAKKVYVIPSVVDTKIYLPNVCRSKRRLTIGWIGTPVTSKYLEDIVPALREISLQRNVDVIAIGARKSSFENSFVNVQDWSQSSEVERIKSFDIGIMPLRDSSWDRGKCGYKLIQYMACGLPVVASPIGVNSLIVKHGVNGFLANSINDWVSRLKVLIDIGFVARKKMGQEGRRLVCDEFSIESHGDRLCEIVKEHSRFDDARSPS